MTDTHSRSAYQRHVAALEERIQRDQALRQAIGGEFIAVGKLEHFLLRSLRLADGHLLADIGCGSGRLAAQLAPFPAIRYIGCDVVPALLDYARELCQRPDWRFVATEGQAIPCDDAVADYACFFSVFTHLLHEDTYRYFHEVKRVLKPGGTFVFSFLEFAVPCHWDTFAASYIRQEHGRHLNQFLDRDAIRAFAAHAGFEIVSIHDGDKPHFPIPEEIVWEGGQRMREFGNLGQSVAILRQPMD
ncbi:MAG: class I SAM-dependent methyltransferase [Opitutae bacterium]|nr:class I SAM-dependent methyltransferase [Opitutae bacterium]